MGWGQDFQDDTFGTQGHVYVVALQTKLAYQFDIQGTFQLSHFSIKCCLNLGASHSFAAASSVDVLGSEVETLNGPLHVSSPLGTRVRIDKMSGL